MRMRDLSRANLITFKKYHVGIIGGSHTQVLERYVYNVITDRLDEIHPLSISDCQWGFRAGRSTIGALLATTSHWFSLVLTFGRRKEICAVFYDYHKAFDSMPHRPLVNKLKTLYVSSYVLRWVADYLTYKTSVCSLSRAQICAR